jgi:hypothetical protein
MDMIALAHSLSLVSLTCGTHTSGSSSTSNREREIGREGAYPPVSSCPPQWPASRGRAPFPGDGFLPRKTDHELCRPRAPPVAGELRRSQAPPAASDPSRRRAPPAVGSPSRRRAPSVAGSAVGERLGGGRSLVAASRRRGALARQRRERESMGGEGREVEEDLTCGSRTSVK